MTPLPDTNPKDLVGRSKISMTCASSIGRLWTSFAMMDGVAKYGAYNYRNAPVSATVYLDACQRHIEAWADRQEMSEDAKCHHLGHACACLFILMDAQAHGTLIDDRAPSKGKVVELIGTLSKAILAKSDASKPWESSIDFDAAPTPITEAPSRSATYISDPAPVFETVRVDDSTLRVQPPVEGASIGGTGTFDYMKHY